MTTAGGVDNGSEASCLAHANPVFLTRPHDVDYWLGVILLLIGLFETSVACVPPTLAHMAIEKQWYEWVGMRLFMKTLLVAQF